MAICGLFAQYFARGGVHVPGDAAATTANIVRDAGLVRLGFVADLAMATSFLVLGLAFYVLFRAVNASAAGALVVFVAVGAGITIVNLLNHFAALLVATDPAYAGLSDTSTQALGLLWLDLHQYGYTTGGILFGLWLLPLGYLAYTSGMFPRSLGMLLMVASVGYLANTFAVFLVPSLDPIVSTIVTAPAGVAEFWMVGYLLFVGVRQRAAAAPRPAVA